MARSKKDGAPKERERAASKDGETRTSSSNPSASRGGGETHQTVAKGGETLTTNQGVVVSDNQNSLKSGVRGPTLLEDFVLREKITHFDHERIPERIVHARGSGAHGYFQVYESLRDLTRASFLQDPKTKTPVFARFSTVAGGAGSGDMPRDVRGFAVKFYTDAGNYDLVGNNVPVFFIQDAMKFPDLVHAVKMEPDRGFPQAASAHDTFWDFVSLMPESMHMLLWVMSDRTIPRSLRMIQGFGVHTFRMVNAAGRSTFVKFHWRPKLGAPFVVWDEAVKINGADPDYHRRDLWEALERGEPAEFELSIQAFSEEEADGFDFDVLDPTKLVPEELVPLRPIGRMVLDKNPVNFFAETEQVAFHPGHLVPGIEFSNDPLLQGRLHSYLDTQLSRLGSANFHEIPINRARNAAVSNHQRDGHMRMAVPAGRVAYEPNTLAPGGPREDQRRGFESYPEELSGEKLRKRSDTFADHYSQARMFWRSMTPPEQRHIVDAFTFELGKVETVAIRRRMLGHLQIVDESLAARVADGLGMREGAVEVQPARPVRDLEPSPALSLLANEQPTLAGRTVAVLVADGSDGALVEKLRAALTREKARMVVVAPKVAGALGADRKTIPADHALAGAPSCLFGAVVIAVSETGGKELAAECAAVAWVSDAFAHLKFIGATSGAAPLLAAANVKRDEGVIELSNTKGIAQFVTAAKQGKLWSREEAIHMPMPPVD